MSLQVKTIREYLNSLDAIIPTYQRSYEWGADQINDFWKTFMKKPTQKKILPATFLDR